MELLSVGLGGVLLLVIILGKSDTDQPVTSQEIAAPVEEEAPEVTASAVVTSETAAAYVVNMPPPPPLPDVQSAMDVGESMPKSESAPATAPTTAPERMPMIQMEKPQKPDVRPVLKPLVPVEAPVVEVIVVEPLKTRPTIPPSPNETTAKQPVQPIVPKPVSVAPEPRAPVEPLPVFEPRSVPEQIAPAPALVQPLEAQTVQTPTPKGKPEKLELPQEPEPVPEFIDVATVTPNSVAAAGEVDGRVALRLLEHGKGPSIQIAWPDGSVAVAKLYDHLSSCLGMKTVLLNNQGMVFDAQSGPLGKPVNLDRYSGFVREILGVQPAAELALIRTLRQLYRGRSGLTVVRLFPRDQDARLLTGLSQLIGVDYLSAHTIQAQYKFNGKSLYAASVRVNGRPIPGEIRLATQSSCSREASS
jgi:hypothetical protein